MSFEGFSMGKMRPKSRQFMKLAINIGQDNYPEIQAKILMINTPFLFKAAWALVSPFINEGTKKKISVLGGSYQEELLKHADADNIPAQFGGKCTCSHHGQGCFFSDKGPWDNYPGDEIGEAAKQAILEEEKKEAGKTEDPFFISEEEMIKNDQIV